MFKRKMEFDKEFVDDVVEYATMLLDSQPNIPYGKLSRKVFSYMISLRGFDQFPLVVSEADYQKMGGAPYYRGVADVEHLGNMLCDFNYHKGIGCYGNGLYFTSNPNRALNYAYRDSKRVITVKFDKSIKIGKFDKVEKNIDQLKKYLGSQPKYSDILVKLFSLDRGKAAMAFGFEGLHMDADAVTVFNRGKIIVSQKEQDRILPRCKYYNPNGTINFEQKYEDDYFPDA